MEMFSPEFQKMIDEQRKKSEAMANEEAVLLSKQMMGLDLHGRKKLLMFMSKQLNGLPLIGYILKMLMEHATANEDYEVCAAIQEVANETNIKMLDIDTIMKNMIAENPGKNLFLDIP